MSWVALVYWNLDMFLSFVTGYYNAGVLILDVRQTSKSYMRSWFPFDLGLLSIEWVLVAITARPEVIKLSRMVRSLRFLRLVRLGHLSKAGSFIEQMEEQITSQVASLRYSLAKIVLRLLLINHLIACLWYGLTTIQEDTNWVKEHGLQNQSPGYLYATSLHWACSQQGVGQTNIEAVTLPERASGFGLRSAGIFSVLVAFGALMIFSSLLSAVSALMANLQKLSDGEIEQFRALKRFFAQNSIDTDLAQRITGFLQRTFKAKTDAKSAEGPLPMWNMLSKPLQAELELQRHKDCMEHLPFLKQLLQHDSSHIVRVLRAVAASMMSHSVLADGDVVFVAGYIARACCFMSGGTYSYTLRESQHKVQRLWAAEMSLWTPWVHQGDLISKNISRLISLEVTDFCDCIGQTVETRQMASAPQTMGDPPEVYARDYVQILAKQPFSDLIATPMSLQGSEETL
ncbi:unnamed protein product, partial [Effrenium voratum]